MTIKAARGSLAALFLACLSIQAATLFCLVARYSLLWREAWPLLKSLLVVYSVPLAVMLGGVFADRGASRSNPQPLTVWIALAISGLWNAMLVAPTLIYFFSPDASPGSVEAALKNSASASFLVAGALTYFFGERK